MPLVQGSEGPREINISQLGVQTSSFGRSATLYTAQHHSSLFMTSIAVIRGTAKPGQPRTLQVCERTSLTDEKQASIKS
jgi:hypothetical protein